jgi:hypothetical protein
MGQTFAWESPPVRLSRRGEPPANAKDDEPVFQKMALDTRLVSAREKYERGGDSNV